MRSSQCGIFLNIEKPRIRYRPSSDFTWMSLMTSGVKIGTAPEHVLARGGAVVDHLDHHQFPLGGFEVVVVVKLLAADELLKLRRSS